MTIYGKGANERLGFMYMVHRFIHITWLRIHTFPNVAPLSLKAHSQDAIFSECDCVFTHRMEWVVWMSMILFTL